MRPKSRSTRSSSRATPPASEVRETRATARSIGGRGPDVGFEVRLGSRQYDVLWEPRETGVWVTLDSRHWASPSGERIEDADWELVLDALWAVAPRSGGAKGLLEWLPDERAYVARRWSLEPEAFILMADPFRLDVLLLHRTLRFQPEAPLDPAATLFPIAQDRARWLAPERRPLESTEWEAIAPRLSSAVASDFALSAHPFTLAIEASPTRPA